MNRFGPPPPYPVHVSGLRYRCTILAQDQNGQRPPFPTSVCKLEVPSFLLVCHVSRLPCLLPATRCSSRSNGGMEKIDHHGYRSRGPDGEALQMGLADSERESTMNLVMLDDKEFKSRGSHGLDGSTPRYHYKQGTGEHIGYSGSRRRLVHR